MIRLLAFDLDGTTITEHKYLSPANRAALEAARDRGVILLPATGRMLSFLPEPIAGFPGIRCVITSNGAAVYERETGRVLYERLIPNEKALAVQELLSDYDIFTEYYQNGRAITREDYPRRAHGEFGFPSSKFHFVDGKDYRLVPDLERMLRETRLRPEKINLPYLKEGLREEIWARLEALGGLRLTSSLPDNIEVNDQHAHKGAALAFMAQRLGVPLSEVMAVGDNGNDVSMLRTAGCSVAVGDGSKEALTAARHVTAPHDEDGLAAAIHRFILEA